MGNATPCCGDRDGRQSKLNAWERSVRTTGGANGGAQAAFAKFQASSVSRGRGTPPVPVMRAGASEPPSRILAVVALALAVPVAVAGPDQLGLAKAAPWLLEVPYPATLVISLLALWWLVLCQLWAKLRLYALGMAIMLFGRDKRWRKTEDPALFGELFATGERRTKRVILIRHGESLWNEVFNRGILRLPFSLAKALIREAFLIPSDDSLFFDSPLNAEGMSQARSLARFLEASSPGRRGDPSEMLEADVAALRGDAGAPAAVLTCSNLRRAMQTALLALPRLAGVTSKVRILSSLQEMTTNVDGVAIAPAGTVDPLEMMVGAGLACDKPFCAEEYFDASENAGQKGIRAKGIDRMEAFCAWALARPEPVVVVVGHSLYFRFLFKTYLPHSSRHQLKKQKMPNGGAVGLTLESTTNGRGRQVFRIAENTITTIYGPK
eukprot:TRINITY_DN25113_c0_g3_i1.p1 TRINITY_DN25113_c0_g3~~TRINITY_DN25113_c0_g3_i1.p1  ORF type:complete len:438 (+),score=67.24 TRINITY_DN25113_c0_g3_i1:85-1398(+)